MIDDGMADGEVTPGDGFSVIGFTRFLAAPPAVVWVALTDHEFLSRWWGDVTVDPRPGGRFDVTWRNPTPAGDRFTTHATITEFSPPHLLETTGDAHGVLRWALTPERTGTTLAFSSTLVLPDEVRAKTLAGWHFHLMALRHALAGGPADQVDLVNLPEWPAIFARYESAGAWPAPPSSG
jgi:uncharacterized protein YndB with AHSA1/START domain